MALIFITFVFALLVISPLHTSASGYAETGPLKAFFGNDGKN